jgi:hypothetical protein
MNIKIIYIGVVKMYKLNHVEGSGVSGIHELGFKLYEYSIGGNLSTAYIEYPNGEIKKVNFKNLNDRMGWYFLYKKDGDAKSQRIYFDDFTSNWEYRNNERKVKQILMDLSNSKRNQINSTSWNNEEMGGVSRYSAHTEPNFPKNNKQERHFEIFFNMNDYQRYIKKSILGNDKEKIISIKEIKEFVFVETTQFLNIPLWLPSYVK